MKFLGYFYGYLTGLSIGTQQGWKLTKSFRHTARTAIKSANLSVCFMGFIPSSHDKKIFECCEISALASSFDLVSDIAKYDPVIEAKFLHIAEEILDKDTMIDLKRLLTLKQQNNLSQKGLSRGIWALKLIFSHLSVSDFWDAKLDIRQAGIFFQMADDLLDYKSDLKTDHLNFLKSEDANLLLSDYLTWDYNDLLIHSRYPIMLRAVLSRANNLANHVQETSVSRAKSKLREHRITT